MLWQAAQGNHVLRRLELQGNKMGGSVSKQLGVFVKANTALVSLNLNDNQLGSDGGQQLGDAFTMNETLQDVSFHSNGMDNKAATIMADSLSENNSLQRLYLAGNKVDKKHKWDLTRKFQGEKIDLQLHGGFSGVKHSFGGTLPDADVTARLKNLNVI